MRRRQFLGLCSVFPITLKTVANPLSGPSSYIDCHVTPRYHEGPFYIRQSPLRQDITEGITGYPMFIRFTLVDSDTCQPIINVPVDIWLADPGGEYSGVNNALLVRGMANKEGTRFLRGRQLSNHDGVVLFKALFPGWYPLTPPHIHFSCHLSSEASFTGQFFIDDAFSEAIYTQAEPYQERGEHPVKLGWRANSRLVSLPRVEQQHLVLEQVIGVRQSDLRPICGYFQPHC